MLEVTKEAKTHLKRLLSEIDSEERIAMRLARKDGTMEVRPDRPEVGDAQYSNGERPLLVVEQSLALELDGEVLDRVQTETGWVLALVSPPSQSSQNRN